MCLLFPLYCCEAEDATIRSLVAALTHYPAKSVFPWDEGMAPIVDAPAKASPAKVVARCLPMWGSTEPIKRYKILAVEEHLRISIRPSDPERYMAVLIRSDHGRRIIVMRYTGEFWWTRPFDVEGRHFRCGERTWP